MSTSDLDRDLAVVYGEYGVPADRLFTEPRLGDGFIEALQFRLGRQIANKMEVLSRVLTLRKTKRLPRLQRRYNGRQFRD